MEWQFGAEIMENVNWSDSSEKERSFYFILFHQLHEGKYKRSRKSAQLELRPSV